MKKLNWIIPLLSIVILGACDTLRVYTFQIDNKTQNEILVNYSVLGKDSTLTVDAGKLEVIHVQKSVGDPRIDICNSGMPMFQHIHLSKSGQQDSTEYVNRELWKLEWLTDYRANYTLTISE